MDPKGRLRCALALARYTGHREGAICNLRASDILRSRDDIRAVLADLGRDESAADLYTHGAIYWRAESDKIENAHVAPLSKPAREEIDHYLRAHPRIGNAWLFPAPGPLQKAPKPGEEPEESPQTPEKPLRVDLASKWLVRAEALAGLPKLAGGRWHPYRRAWATERKGLPDADVAAAGGWRDTRALKMSYQHADAGTMLRVVEESA